MAWTELEVKILASGKPKATRCHTREIARELDVSAQASERRTGRNSGVSSLARPQKTKTSSPCGVEIKVPDRTSTDMIEGTY